MKKIKVFISIGFLLGIFLPQSVWATVPQTINFQGKLTNTNKVPLENVPGDPDDGQVDVTFSIYDGPDASAALLWGPETHSDVAVAQGILDVLLGDIVPMDPPTVFSGAAVYLEIGVDDGVNNQVLSPRKEFSTVSYAFRTQQAADIDDETITEGKLAAFNTPADGQVLTWDGSNNRLEWLDSLDTTLNETQVDAFVANNGYSTGAHTVDTTLDET